jgi:methylisocitrate lyase
VAQRREDTIDNTTRFRRLIEADEILVMPVAHDSLTARIIERTGFRAVACGGYGATASMLGAPDSSQLSMTEMADFYARICEATSLPVFVDGDTGFGNSTNVARMVRRFERAGVAGLFIEDQVFPKRCGHMTGKDVVPAADMVEKLKAALDARHDPDLVIMARTDALAVHGLDDAIARGQLYREAGADLIFVEAPADRDEMRRICREIDAPCLANNLDGGRSPLVPAAELQEIGYATVAFPVTATYTIAKAVSEVMAVLAREGTTASQAHRMTGFDEFNELVGLTEMRAREAGYQDQAAKLLAGARSGNKTRTKPEVET